MPLVLFFFYITHYTFYITVLYMYKYVTSLTAGSEQTLGHVYAAMDLVQDCDEQLKPPTRWADRLPAPTHGEMSVRSS